MYVGIFYNTITEYPRNTIYTVMLRCNPIFILIIFFNTASWTTYGYTVFKYLAVTNTSQPLSLTIVPNGTLYLLVVFSAEIEKLQNVCRIDSFNCMGCGIRAYSTFHKMIVNSIALVAILMLVN